MLTEALVTCAIQRCLVGIDLAEKLGLKWQILVLRYITAVQTHQAGSMARILQWLKGSCSERSVFFNNCLSVTAATLRRTSVSATVERFMCTALIHPSVTHVTAAMACHEHQVRTHFRFKEAQTSFNIFNKLYYLGGLNLPTFFT